MPDGEKKTVDAASLFADEPVKVEASSLFAEPEAPKTSTTTANEVFPEIVAKPVSVKDPIDFSRGLGYNFSTDELNISKEQMAAGRSALNRSISSLQRDQNRKAQEKADKEATVGFRLSVFSTEEFAELSEQKALLETQISFKEATGDISTPEERKRLENITEEVDKMADTNAEFEKIQFYDNIKTANPDVSTVEIYDTWLAGTNPNVFEALKSQQDQGEFTEKDAAKHNERAIQFKSEVFKNRFSSLQNSLGEEFFQKKIELEQSFMSAETPEQQQALKDEYDQLLSNETFGELSELGKDIEALQVEAEDYIKAFPEYQAELIDNQTKQLMTDENYKNQNWVVQRMFEIDVAVQKVLSKVIKDVLTLPRTLSLDNEFGWTDKLARATEEVVDMWMGGNTPSKLDRNLIEDVATIRGNQLVIRKGEVQSVRDSEGYVIQDKAQVDALVKEYEANKSSIPTDTQTNFDVAFPKFLQMGGDMALLMMGAGKGTAMLKGLGVSQKTAQATALSGAVSAQVHNQAYESAIRNNLAPAEAAKYAWAVSGAIALTNQINPQYFVFAKAGLIQQVTNQTMRSVVNGTTKKEAYLKAAQFFVKQGLGEAAQETAEIPAETMISALANNMTDGRATFDLSQELNDYTESAIMGFVGGSAFSVLGVQSRGRMNDEALRAAVFNPEGFRSAIQNHIGKEVIVNGKKRTFTPEDAESFQSDFNAITDRVQEINDIKPLNIDEQIRVSALVRRKMSIERVNALESTSDIVRQRNEAEVEGINKSLNAIMDRSELDPVYEVDGEVLTKQEFLKKIEDPAFVSRMRVGDVEFKIKNDLESADKLNDAIQKELQRTETTTEDKKFTMRKGDDGLEIVNNSTGKVSTRKDANFNEVLETFKVENIEKFRMGRRVSETASPDIEESEVDRMISEESENPQEIAAVYLKELHSSEGSLEGSTDAVIARFLTGFPFNSIREFGDANAISGREQQITMNYVRKTGEPIDTQIMLLSEAAGFEITGQDVIDFIFKYPNGRQSFSEGTQRLTDLESRFEVITGFPITEKYASDLLGRDQKSFDSMTEDAMDIIEEQGITEENIDELEESLFRGFPYTAEEFNLIKNYLKDEPTSVKPEKTEKPVEGGPTPEPKPAKEKTGRSKATGQIVKPEETVDKDVTVAIDAVDFNKTDVTKEKLVQHTKDPFHNDLKETTLAEHMQIMAESLNKGKTFDEAHAAALKVEADKVAEKLEPDDDSVSDEEAEEAEGAEVSTDTKEPKGVAAAIEADIIAIDKGTVSPQESGIGKKFTQLRKSDPEKAKELTAKFKPVSTAFKEKQAKLAQEGEKAAKSTKEPLSTKKEFTTVVGSAPAQTGRIQPSPIIGKKPKKLNEIVLDLSKSVGRTIITTKKPSSRARSLGSFNPRNTAIKIKYAGDLDVTAHELGHSLDDQFGLLRDIPENQLTSFDTELSKFWEFGSTAPKSLDPAESMRYRRGEGVAEWIRAHIVNPEAAAKSAPKFAAWYEQTVSEKTKNAVLDFSTDVREFSGATSHDAMMSNVEFDPKKGEGMLASLFTQGRTTSDEWQLTFADRVAQKMTNQFRFSEKAFEFAMGEKGVVDILPENDFRVMARTFLGINEKFDDMFENGIVDSKNKRVRDKKTGKAMTISWLIEELNNDDEKSLEEEMKEVITFMIAERTVELPSKFAKKQIEDDIKAGLLPAEAVLNQFPEVKEKHADAINKLINSGVAEQGASRYDFTEKVLTGIGGGIFKDVEVASKRLSEHAELADTDKVKKKRIEESARRYRVYSDAILQYMADKGRISTEALKEIRDTNTQYVALQRVIEVEPGTELETFSAAKGSVGGVSQPIQKIKGSARLIKNPYSSLMDFVYKGVREADRNDVMTTFRDILNTDRGMAEGDPLNLAQIGRLASAEDKNTIVIYVNGEAEYWQFEDDVFKALKGISDTAYRLPGVITVLPKILRWSVTNFPVFGVRNWIRDTQNRVVITRASSGLKEFTGTQDDIDRFRLFGGGQAGYYIKDRYSYYQKMESAMKDMAKDKKIILLDPSRLKEKMWDKGYRRFIEGAETSNRVAEFRAAYKKGKEKGLDDYNASLFAAFEARDLLDFGVAGEYMQVINQMVPFSNAAVQGIKRSIIAAKEDPKGFTLRWALYAAVPAVINRVLVGMMGDEREKEYRQFPAWRRDLFYNIPISDTWLSIPKPFELGVMGSGAERLVDMLFYGNEDAFDGYAGSVARSTLPVDEGALAGPGRAIFESVSNWDVFREKHIIPPHEENLKISKRKTDRASRLGKMIQSISGIGGDEPRLDARLVDQFIKGQFSYFGNFALKLGDLGREEGGAFSFHLGDLGVFTRTPVWNAKDVQWVIGKAKEEDMLKDPDYQEMNLLINDYFNAKNDEQKARAGKVIRGYATRLRKYWEKKLEKRPDLKE